MWPIVGFFEEEIICSGDFFYNIELFTKKILYSIFYFWIFFYLP